MNIYIPFANKHHGNVNRPCWLI